MSVEWHDRASDRLADIFVVIPLEEQDRLYQHVLDINSRLAVEAMTLGESRGTAHRRVWFAYPLVVQYDALTDPPRVLVFHVAHLRPGAFGREGE